jgi:hypothetical protein
MQYLYILLLGLIIYYIISRYYENYTENFDPSLVPVSSIVTLAKVAQKLVDGNGTLTNPGNLTLGTPSAVGNLLVTGNNTTSGTSTLTGNTTVGGTLGVTGATTVGGNLGVTGASTLTGNTTVGGTLGVTGNTTVGGTLGVTGNSTVGGTLGVTGTTTIGPLKMNGIGTGLNIQSGTASPDNTIVKFGDGSGWRMKFARTDGGDTGTYIYDNGNIVSPTVTATQSLNINSRGGQQGYSLYSQTGGYFGIWRNADLLTVDAGGNLNIAGQLNIVPKGSIMMWSGASIPAGWALCNGQNGTPNMQGYVPIGGSGSNNGPTSTQTGKGTWGADDGGKDRNLSIYYINFIMKI